MIDRRDLLLSATAAASFAAGAPRTHAQARGKPAFPPPDSFPLWPGRPPGSRSATPRYDAKMEGGELHLRGIATPTLNIYRAPTPDGRAIITCPGGGYEFLSTENEGIDPALRFNPLGITVAVLSYRLPAEGWDAQADVPLQDAQRALRLLRHRARDFAIDPARIAVMGFSAGGHLAASLAVGHDEHVYAPVDAADRMSARPTVAALIYPVIGMGAITHAGSRDHLLGPNASPALVERRTASAHVTARTPPCFLTHAIDDTVVSVDNSLEMLAACRRAAVPAEAHIFEKGGHGFGFHAPAEIGISTWPDLFLRWSRDRF